MNPNLMRKSPGWLYLVLLLLFFRELKAQDTLVFSDHQKVVGKVIQVGYEEIKYKLLNDTLIERICLRKDLQMIIYTNGKRDLFPSETLIVPVKTEEKLYHHNFALNLLPLVAVQLGLQYQLTLQKAGISVVFPVQFMLLKQPIVHGTTEFELGYKNYNFGTGLYFHKKLSNTFTYFGPLFQMVNQNIKSTYTILDYNRQAYNYVQECDVTYYNFFLTIGRYYANRHSSFNLFISLGAQYGEYSNYMYIPFTDTKINPDYWSFWVNGGICLGFGF